jgi:hypothetical protein
VGKKKRKAESPPSSEAKQKLAFEASSCDFHHDVEVAHARM